MLKRFCAALVLALTFSATALAEEEISVKVSDAILDEMAAKQQARNAGSGLYYVTVEENSLAGGGAVSVFEKISDRSGYIHLPPDGIAALGILSTDVAAMHAIDSDSTFGLLDVITSGWATESGLYAELFDALKRYASKEKDAEATIKAMQTFRKNAKFVEKQNMGGRESFFLHADGLNHKQVSEGVTYNIKEMGLWIDVNDYVITGMSFTGDSKNGKKKETFEISQELSDYRLVRGASILIPHKKTMGVRLGQLDDTETKRIKEALAQAEKQNEYLYSQYKSGIISYAQYEMIQSRMQKMIHEQQDILSSIADKGVGTEIKVTRTWSSPTKEGLKQALREAMEESTKIAGAKANLGVSNAADTAAAAADAVK